MDNQEEDMPLVQSTTKQQVSKSVVGDKPEEVICKDGGCTRISRNPECKVHGDKDPSKFDGDMAKFYKH